MKSKRKILVLGFVAVAAVDMIGIITMITDPDLTERVIPALVGVQILGFFSIAAIFIIGSPKNTGETEPQEDSASTTKEWALWLFGFIALMYLLRAVLALINLAAHGWSRPLMTAPVVEIIMASYFLFLIFKAKRSIGKKKPMITEIDKHN